MRIHVIPHPTVPTDPKITADAFNQMAIRFSQLMTKRGHEIYFYGTKEFRSQISVTKYVNLFCLKDYQGVKMNFNDGRYLSWNLPEEVKLEKRNITSKFYLRLMNRLLNRIKEND